MKTKKFAVTRSSDKESLSNLAIKEIAKINFIDQKVEAWEVQIKKWNEYYSLRDKPERVIDLFKIELTKPSTGHFYYDFILNSYPPTREQSEGADVLIKEVRCYLELGLCDDRSVIHYKPGYSIRLEIKMENKSVPSEQFASLIVFDFNTTGLCVNWLADNRKKRLGFGVSSYYAHITVYRPGFALIFFNDLVRQKIISELESTFLEIEKKFDRIFCLTFYTEEQIRLAREERPRQIRN